MFDVAFRKTHQRNNLAQNILLATPKCAGEPQPHLRAAACPNATNTTIRLSRDSYIVIWKDELPKTHRNTSRQVGRPSVLVASARLWHDEA